MNKGAAVSLLKFLAVLAFAATLVPCAAALAQNAGHSSAPGDPFVNNRPMDDFKLPSAAQTKNGKFTGFDFDKGSRYADQLNIKHKTGQYSQAQKERAFGGSSEYNRELGTRDALERFKETESDMLRQDNSEIKE
jgi:hypothetical protein